MLNFTKRSFGQAIEDIIATTAEPARLEERASAYARERNLAPELVALSPAEKCDFSLEGTRLVVEKLAARLIASRQATGRDLARQEAMAVALLAEKRRLDRLIRDHNASQFAAACLEAAE